MVHSDQYIALGHHVVFLFPFLDIFLLEDFHGIDLVGVFALLFDEHHLSVGAFSDDREHVELVKSQQWLITFLHLNYNQ